MANNNNSRTIKLLILVLGFVLTALVTMGGTFIAVGQDKATINNNSKTVEANTVAIRNLEQAYASQSSTLEYLREQNEKMDEKLDRMMRILIEHDGP